MSMDEVEKSMDTPKDIPCPGPTIRTGSAKPRQSSPKDLWIHKSESMLCRICIYYVPKGPSVGRCRRHAPVANVGYPVVYPTDWCGDHKLDKVDF